MVTACDYSQSMLYISGHYVHWVHCANADNEEKELFKVCEPILF